MRRPLLSAGLTMCLLATGSGCEFDDCLDRLLGESENAPETVPELDDTTFTDSTQIDHDYFPLVPGTTYTYESQTEDGTETVIVEVLSETREVAGIDCVVVRDRVFLDDLLIEDTLDFYAQDDAGNVWYMGEEVDNYNYDDDDNLIDVTHEGSWEAGKDVAGLGVIALPGHIMRASPTPGAVYHQEFYEGEAEDTADVVALNVSVTLGDGTTHSCLQTHDFTPLEPGVEEYKYYAAGIGLVLAEHLDGSERLELIEVTPEP